MKEHNQNGFGLVPAFLILIIVGLIGFTGWYVLNSKNQTDKTLSEASSSASAASASQKYLVIKEWGVKVKIDSSLGQLSYTIGGNNYNLHFKSDLEKKLPSSTSDCITIAGSEGIGRESSGMLTYPDGSHMTDEVAASIPALKHIGNYFYRRIYPQTSCESIRQLVTQIDTAYRNVFDSLTEE